MKLSVDLLLPSNSPGLVHDAAVLTKAGELKFGSKIKFRTIILPEEVANSKNQDFDLASSLSWKSVAIISTNTCRTRPLLQIDTSVMTVDTSSHASVVVKNKNGSRRDGPSSSPSCSPSICLLATRPPHRNGTPACRRRALLRRAAAHLGGRGLALFDPRLPLGG